MVAKKLKLFSGLRFKNVVIESLAVFDTISSLQKKRATKTRRFAKMVKRHPYIPRASYRLWNYTTAGLSSVWEFDHLHGIMLWNLIALNLQIQENKCN